MLLQAELKALKQSQSVEKPIAQTLIAPRVMDVVNRNRRPIYRMFTIETNLMNEVLKFTQINIAKLGLEKAAMDLRAGFARHLHRFSEKFDMAERCDDLLRIATDALRRDLPTKIKCPWQPDLKLSRMPRRTFFASSRKNTRPDFCIAHEHSLAGHAGIYAVAAGSLPSTASSPFA
jgi:hypothetical protein